MYGFGRRQTKALATPPTVLPNKSAGRSFSMERWNVSHARPPVRWLTPTVAGPATRPFVEGAFTGLSPKKKKKTDPAATSYAKEPNLKEMNMKLQQNKHKNKIKSQQFYDDQARFLEKQRIRQEKEAKRQLEAERAIQNEVQKVDTESNALRSDPNHLELRERCSPPVVDAEELTLPSPTTLSIHSVNRTEKKMVACSITVEEEGKRQGMAASKLPSQGKVAHSRHLISLTDAFFPQRSLSNCKCFVEDATQAPMNPQFPLPELAYTSNFKAQAGEACLGRGSKSPILDESGAPQASPCTIPASASNNLRGLSALFRLRERNLPLVFGESSLESSHEVPGTFTYSMFQPPVFGSTGSSSKSADTNSSSFCGLQYPMDVPPVVKDEAERPLQSPPASHMLRNEAGTTASAQLSATTAQPKEKTASTGSLRLSSHCGAMPFGGTQSTSYRWLAGLRCQSSSNGQRALFSVSPKGKTAIRMAPGTCDSDRDSSWRRSAFSEEIVPQDVRRVSSHAVAVVSASASPIGEGAPQVALISARRTAADGEDGKTALNASWMYLEPRPHLGGATAVAPFLPIDGAALTLATGGADGAVYSWSHYGCGDTRTARLHSLVHRQPVLAIETLPKADLVVSASRPIKGSGSEIVAFDARETKLVQSWKSSDHVDGMSRTSHSQVLDISLLRTDFDQHKLFDLRSSHRPILSFGWSSDYEFRALGRPIFVRSWCIQGCPDGRLRLWDMRRANLVQQELKVCDAPLHDMILEAGANAEIGHVIALSSQAAFHVPLLISGV